MIGNGWRHWSLRRRLSVVLVGLAATGLAAFAVVAVVALDRSLTTRADSMLLDMANRVGSHGEARRPPPQDREDQLPSDFVVINYDSSGKLQWESGTDGRGPLVADSLVRSPANSPVGLPDRFGGVPWRAIVVEVAGGDRIVFAVSLESEQATVQRLILIEVGVGLAILAIVACLARVMVRAGLVPLTRIEHTAQAIASGELDRRVPDDDGRTEVGQLARSLNIMLERLGRAIAERQRSEELLRHFVADASHELRTPLTSVRGFAELYRHGTAEQDPVAGQLLGRIEREAERMGLLVDDLMLLAQADQHRSLELCEVNLVELTAEAVTDARARQPGRVITFDAAAPRVRGVVDRFRLHQVISNLLVNALTHTPEAAPIDVRVGTERWRGTAAALVIGRRPTWSEELIFVEVHDHGPGIPADDLPYIFDRFYRANRGPVPATSTGLGLAIVAALVDAHDGQIEVASSPGAGTRVRVRLPIDGPAEL